MDHTRRLLKVIDTLSEWLAKYTHFLIFVIILATLTEIVIRNLLRLPCIWGHELNALLFAIFAVTGGAYAFLRGEHIKLDVLYSRWSERTRAIVDLITFPALVAWCGVLVFYGGQFWWNSMIRFEHSASYWGPPLYPFKMFFPLSALLLLLQGIAKFIRDLRIVRRGS